MRPLSAFGLIRMDFFPTIAIKHVSTVSPDDMKGFVPYKT